MTGVRILRGDRWWSGKRRCGPAARHALACLLASPVVLTLHGQPAAASCDQSGSSINCTGTTTSYNGGTQSGITLTVQPGATVVGPGGTDAITFTNPSGVVPNNYINNGTIDGTTAIVSAGGGTDNFINNGLLTITAAGSGATYSMFGSNFTQTTNGTLGIRVDSFGGNDVLLSFTAALNGKLLAIVQPGIYNGATCYCGVITTFAGVSGTFASPDFSHH